MNNQTQWENLTNSHIKWFKPKSFSVYGVLSTLIEFDNSVSIQWSNMQITYMKFAYLWMFMKLEQH